MQPSDDVHRRPGPSDRRKETTSSYPRTSSDPTPPLAFGWRVLGLALAVAVVALTATLALPGAAAHSGGPDDHGYVYDHRHDVGTFGGPWGPSMDYFDWTPLGEDPSAISGEGYGPVPIGFAFPFYGERYPTVQICLTGYVTFPGAGSCSDPQEGAYIAPYGEKHDDIITDEAGEISVGPAHRLDVSSVLPPTAEAGPFTIEFYGEDDCGFGERDVGAQVALYPTGRIEFRYDGVNYQYLCPAVAGIQSPAAVSSLDHPVREDGRFLIRHDDGIRFLPGSG